MSHPERRRTLWITFLGFLLLLGAAVPVPAVRAEEAPAGSRPAALDKPVPENLADLLAIQKQVQKVVPQCLACTVGIRIGPSAGSGVIISEDGYVLTAGHVAGRPKQRCTIILPNGKEIRGQTLGINSGIDSGLIKITTEGKYPYAPMGKSGELKEGQWCLSVGHPGGYKAGRDPVVRLGRVLNNSARIIRTDCALVGGDSGGPLFDLEGNVIGIHSRISESIAANIHVPVDTYRETWDRLADGEVWGGRLGRPGRPRRDAAYFGITLAEEARGCLIESVTPESPAEKAGLQADDKILRFDGTRVENLDELRGLVADHVPGDTVKVEVLRGDEIHTLKVTLGRRRE